MRKFYIDESGDLGIANLDNRYFVICAVEVLSDNRLKKTIKKYLTAKKIDEIKGANLTESDRQNLINSFCKKDDYCVHYIILDKNNLWKKKLFNDKNTLFNYIAGFLFEDILKSNTEDILLFFDKRTVKVQSKYNLENYIRMRMEYIESMYNLNLQYINSKSSYLVQLADFYANTIYRRYKNGNIHFYKEINIETSIKFPKKNFGQ